MNTFVTAMQNESEKSFTENGANAFNTTKSSLLDFFALGSAMRTRSESDIEKKFFNAYNENELYAIRALFYTRDVRGGQGERRTFRIAYSWLIRQYPEIASKITSYIPKYGRWDDLFFDESTIQFNASLIKECFTKFQSSNDLNDLLFYKWLPSENTSSKETVNRAKSIRNILGISSKNYRKILSSMREKVDIVERKMTSDRWNEIKYEAIPSRANLLYKDAFMKHDPLRRKEYFEKLKKHETKINSATLYPYEIVEQSWYNEDETLNQLWDHLPDYCDGKQAIVMADTSGSMSGTPMNVALSLAIYFAERNKNKAFKDVFMTFSCDPCFHTLKGKTLHQKLSNLDDDGWDMNTDLEKAFKYILKVAKKNNVPKEEMPETLYIVSDMEFDASVMNRDKTTFNNIKQRYLEEGYSVPSIVFWNVNARNDTLPVQKNELGVALVSGCSPSIFKMAMSKNVDPYSFMMDVLNSKQYSDIVL